MKKRTTLRIPESHVAYAESYGAMFDKFYGEWYVNGDVPNELVSYEVKEERRRDYVAESIPACPKCGSQMKLSDGKAGPFWSCSNFPRCRGSSNIDSSHFQIPTKNTKQYATSDIYQKNNERKDIPPEVLEEINRITILAVRLLNGRIEAERWFNKEKITFQGKKPLEIMFDVDGCKKVEALLLTTVGQN